MEYPKNGSIVIIDDKYEEVEGLIRVFSSKGIPVTYFNGEPDKLITLNGTRIVFLDLDLKLGARDSEEKDIISTVFANLKKIVPQNNGGYILVLWSTRDSEFGENVETEIKKMQAREAPIIYEYPLEIVRISKHDVSIREEGKLNFDLNKIEEQINELVPENSILNLVTYWENKVSEASKNVISHFDGITHTENKQKLLLALFADSSTPEGSLNQDTIIAPAISPMSVLLSDQLSSKISSHNLSVIGRELTNILKRNEKIDLESVAKINTFYHIDKDISCSNAPGSVFLYQEYMDKYSCSSQDCSTKWAENLFEKILKDFEPSSMDTSIRQLYNAEVEKNKKLKMPYIEQKSYDEHVEIAYKKGFSLEDEMKKICIGFSLEFDENKKKECVEQYSQLTNELFIQNLIVFVFGKEMDESVKQELNVKGDFDALSELEKLNLLEEYYVSKQKELIEKKHNENTIPIFLEFSPDCDYVQKNRKKLRLVFGVMYPYSCYVKDEKNFKGENYIYTPIVEYNKLPYKIVLDLHTVTGINENALSNMQPIFRLRKELLVDIQQKIASHIARPGFFNMNDYLEK